MFIDMGMRLGLGQMLKKAIFAVLFVLALAGVSVPARAQVAAATAVIAGEAVMSGVMSDLSNSIQQALDRLDMSVSSGTFLMRMQLQILLAEVESRASVVVGKTFKELDESQQRFFIEARVTLDEVERKGENLLEDADALVQRVEFLLGNTFVVGHEPRLRSHEPRVVISSGEGDAGMLNVRFSGSWLANGVANLRFGDTSCKLLDSKEPSLGFDCPNTLFVAKDALRRARGDLVVVGDQNWWDSIVSFFGGGTKTKTYPVSIEVLPPNFGDVAVNAAYAVSREERKAHAPMPFDSGAQHCVWGSSQLQNITPAAGWQIDVASGVQVSVNSSSDGKHEIRNLTGAGFQFYAEGRNKGRCRRVLGETVSRDARGWHNGTLSWTEVRTVIETASGELLNASLGWGDSRVVQLPDTTSSFVVHLKRFDGSVNEYNSVAADDFLMISRDEAGNSLKIAPRRLKDAFR
jgi:hypothetical protein